MAGLRKPDDDRRDTTADDPLALMVEELVLRPTACDPQHVHSRLRGLLSAQPHSGLRSPFGLISNLLGTKVFSTEAGIDSSRSRGGHTVKTSLLGKVIVTAAVLVAGVTPLLAGSPSSPSGPVFTSLRSPFRNTPANAVTAGTLITAGVAHKATRAKPRTPVALAVVHPNFVVRKLPMTPSGLVSDSVRKSIKRCYNQTQDVWLTFDDGYTSQDNLSSILGTLKANNVRGRFFLIGSWARRHPAMVNQIVAAGHFVENHTDKHAYLGQLSDPAASEEIRFGQASNSYPKLLRP